MATTASGLTIPGPSPTTTPATPIQNHWNNLGTSLNGRIVVPVASVTARAALVAALTAEGYTISASNPIIVWRADAGAGRQLEVSINGTTWANITHTATVGATGAVASSGAMVRMGDAAAVVADGSSTYRITVTMAAAYSTVSGDRVDIGIIRPNDTVVFATRNVTLSGVWGNGQTITVFDTPSAGSIVYSGSFQRVVGTGACSAQSAQIMVERIA